MSTTKNNRNDGEQDRPDTRAILTARDEELLKDESTANSDAQLYKHRQRIRDRCEWVAHDYKVLVEHYPEAAELLRKAILDGDINDSSE